MHNSNPFPPATLATLEHLTTKLNAYNYAVGHPNEAREESRLFSAAVDAGMDRDHDDLHGWVAERVAAFLTSGTYDDFDDEDYGLGRDESGRWEYAA
ncbi:hypothetical protein WJS89_10440 [Sphingomicrobium sp. XHP0235]|uniref:hypothetical protein n=1 Tax=Sphingomicrobium aquimarinum TaxID=3133971 RepID=UPI0031FEF49C